MRYFPLLLLSFFMVACNLRPNTAASTPIPTPTLAAHRRLAQYPHAFAPPHRVCATGHSHGRPHFARVDCFGVHGGR
ncbi:MAG: hypothetical protein IPL28_02435 [Chloroflexi bacterium]|nr:hypothetical protein [Chloroflexota bacterium]